MSRVTGYKLIYTLGEMGRLVDEMTGTWAKDLSPYAAPDATAMPAEPEAVPAGSVIPLLPQALPLSEAGTQKFALSILEVPQSTNLQTDRQADDEGNAIRLNVFDQSESGSVVVDLKTGLIHNAIRQNRGAAATPGGSAASKVTQVQEAQVSRPPCGRADVL